MGLLVWFPLGLLWVAGAALGLTQWTDGSITVDLLVARQTGLERESQREMRNVKSKCLMCYSFW